MSIDLLTYRGPVNSSHGGGVIVGYSEHDVLLSVNGSMMEVAVDGDYFCCPICPPHCCNPLIPKGFAKVEGRKTMRVTDSSACGATNFTPCDNTYSGED
jgi:hypothetical protein